MADPNRKVTFFDPHPGFAGAAIPIPDPVKKAADSLAGQSMTVAEAIARIQAVTAGSVTDVPDKGWIKLQLGASPPMHVFRVIRYR